MLLLVKTSILEVQTSTAKLMSRSHLDFLPTVQHFAIGYIKSYQKNLIVLYTTALVLEAEFVH